jgi:preprotein translocase subunit SecD
MRKNRIRLGLFLTVVVVTLAASLIADNRPLLGLDLQGGVSVVLKPKNAVGNDELNEAIAIIRNRVDSLGVAEPEITRQGGNVLVQIPGVNDTQRALDLVGTTAELRFRPVLAELPPEGATLESLGIDPNATTTTATPTTTVAASTTSGTATTTSTTTTSTTTTVPLTAEERRKQLEDRAGITVPTTSADDDKADQTVVLPEYDPKTGKMTRRWQMGPAQLTGKGVSGADAMAPVVASGSGDWTVSVSFKGGADGTNQLNTLATSCVNYDATICPAGRLGITLDGRVQFAGTINSQSNPPFPDGQVSISGGYSKSQAKDVATALKYGALPVELVKQSTQTVSATLGSDALHAGIVAGILGLAIVALYVLGYYRLLGAFALSSLILSGALLWVVIAYLGETKGLAITLAGITGIIVSIGVSLDSNIVYFEHMKEDVKNGRTPRSAADRSFAGAWSTVVKADVASLIGAGALYFLTVGSVKGFALYLGLATMLDLVATWFFLAPSVQLMARTGHYARHPAWYGLTRPVPKGAPPAGTPPKTAPTTTTTTPSEARA